jgi:hypothetical protein
VSEVAAIIRYSAFASRDALRPIRSGCKSIYNHLRTTKRNLKRAENVATARWGLPEGVPEVAEDQAGSKRAVWVQLIEPEDGSDHAALLFGELRTKTCAST